MKALRIAAIATLSLIALCSLGGSLLPQFDYRAQDRQNVSVQPSAAHWLGSDALGRDRLARLLHATRLSLLLAPAAAGLSILLALLMGAGPGFAGGAVERAAKAAIDLMLSVPWLFLLLMVRAMLPLNTSPGASAVITFAILGLLGWGVPARILLARSRALRQADFILLARAAGVSRARLLWVHVTPNLGPVLLAQFWIAVPVFILAEANLSLLGLGVSEPMPSLGSLLREMESALSLRGDLCVFAGFFVLLLVVGSLQVIVHQREVS
ncbi:MAG TPA: ABC transporter permease subunit [Candidatus Angelobacter sp.]|jgi:ABC-type dipeptide/oligopeptide/nickel transport system permease subunit|nr:ABC transporter permease subunit [Candidatus Angelobacter sp.]